MGYCDDCGTKLSGGICPNCQEELYIFENQHEDLPPLSDEFSEKVKQQRKEVHPCQN
jgi:hypothetical protein